MSFRLSDRSRARLKGVHPALVGVIEAAIRTTPVDFMVTEGLRTNDRQAALVRAGASRTLNSRHLTGHAVDVAAVVLGGLGFRWDPFDLARRRADRAEQVAASAQAEAAARSAEAQGQAGQVVRLDAAVRSTVALERVTNRSIQTARIADDASVPLPPDRVDRLRDHDRELCRLSPDLLGCPAAPDPAGGGQPTVRPAPPA